MSNDDKTTISMKASAEIAESCAKSLIWLANNINKEIAYTHGDKLTHDVPAKILDARRIVRGAVAELKPYLEMREGDK